MFCSVCILVYNIYKRNICSLEGSLLDIIPGQNTNRTKRNYVVGINVASKNRVLLTLSNFKSSESITHRLTKVTRLFLQCQDRSNTHKPSHKHSTLTLNTAIHIVHCSHGTKHEGLIFFERKLSSNLDQSSDKF